MSIENLVRENIKRLTPYSSARKEFSGAAQVFLDANENSFGSPFYENYNRYPDPLQIKIKEKIALQKGISPSEIFIGNGSDEAIDLLLRVFCEPRSDNVLICPPTYGIYEVLAAINDIRIKRVNLTGDFRLAAKKIKRESDNNTKLLFICSPNNPTGNSFPRNQILDLAESFRGIVVVDEAYIHFSKEKSLVEEINNFQNLVVLQTFSKAWGLAGLRVGSAFANERIINLFNKVKLPYNISEVVQNIIYDALENKENAEKNIARIIAEREKLIAELSKISIIEKIFPTDANFVLAKTTDADSIYEFLLSQKIIVRNRSNVELCEGCLRITIGMPGENKKLIEALKNYEKNLVY